MLVVISILGVLGGVSVGTFSHMQSKARIVGLDESLRSVATAVDSQIVLENMTVKEAYSSVMDPNSGFLKDSDSIVFDVGDVTSEQFVVRATYKGETDPCRQVDLLGGEPENCEGIGIDNEAALKADEEAKRKADEEAKRKAEDEARNKAEAEARKQAEAEEAAKRKAEEEAAEKAKAEAEAQKKAEAEAADRAKAEEDARAKAEEEARKKAEEEAKTPKEFRSSINKAGSRWNWWNPASTWTNGEGEWVATFEFSNTWIRGQELDISIVKTYADGNQKKQKKSNQKNFWVPAEGTATLEIWDNELEIEDDGGYDGVIAIEITVTRIDTNTEDWKKTGSKVEGPTARVDLPPVTRNTASAPR